MDKKVLALFLILVAWSCLSMGCSGKKSEAMATPSPSTVPAGGSPSISLDPSLADISGEGMSEGSEAWLPTPTLD